MKEVIPMDEAKGRWFPQIKGDRTGSFEISIVREDNFHGRKSYGWACSSKIMVLSQHALGAHPITQKMWDFAVAEANEMAKEKNNDEGFLGDAEIRPMMFGGTNNTYYSTAKEALENDRFWMEVSAWLRGKNTLSRSDG